MIVIRNVILFTFISTFLSCINSNSSASCCMKGEVSSNLLISLEYQNIWDLCPVFKLEEAIECSNNSNKNILIIFYASIFSGNDDKLWEVLNLSENHLLMKEKFIVCPLNVDIESNREYQEIYIESYELASIVVLSHEKDVVSEVMFYQGRSSDNLKLTSFLEKYN